MKYIEMAIGKLSNRGILVKANEVIEKVNLIKGIDKIFYCSVYYYDEIILEHFKIRKTVKSFKGKYYINKLIFDLDNHDNKKSESVFLYEIKEIIKILEDDWQLDRYSIGYYFSGRGFHLEIPDIFGFEPSTTLPITVKATLSKYFPNIDLSIYSATGLISMNGSMNQHSKLYKTQLSYEEITELTLEQIKELAKTNKQRNIPIEKDNIPKHPTKIIYSNYEEKEKPKYETTAYLPCRQNILKKGAVEGDRHLNLLRLISLSRRSGMTLEECLAIGDIWNQNGNKPLIKYELENQIKSIYAKTYSPGCSDFILAKKDTQGKYLYCETKCMFYKKKNMNIEVDTSKTVEEKYVHFVRVLMKNSINIAKILNIKSEINLVPTDYALFIGGSGLNKTTIAQNIAVKLRNTNLKNKTVLYLNLEFGIEMLYRRNLQIALGKSKNEMAKYYAVNNNGLSKYIDHIHLMEISPTLSDLRKAIYNTNPALIIIDTLGDLDVSSFGDKTETIGEEMKNIARETKTIIIGIQHISKSSAFDTNGNPKELTIQSALGSGKLHQKADWVFGVEGLPKTPYRKFRILKARDGEATDNMLFFNKNNFRIMHIGD